MYNNLWPDPYSEDLFFSRELTLGSGFTGSRIHHQLNRNKVKQWMHQFVKKARKCTNQHEGPKYIKHGTIDVSLLTDYENKIELIDENIHKFGVHSQDYWNDDEFTVDLKRALDIDCFTVSRINCSVPGSTTYMHYDFELQIFRKYVTLVNNIKNKDVGHCLIFLQDQLPGQTFFFDDEEIQWKAGDAFLFPWYMIHGGVNKTDQNRYAAHLTTIEGIK